MENHKKNILMCLYYYYPYISGLTLYAKTMGEELVKKGYNVTVYCSQHKKGLPLEEMMNGVKVIREKPLFLLNKGVIMPLYRIKTIFKAMKFDIVNFHFPNADLGLSSLFIPRKKIFINYQCDLNLGKGFFNKLIEKISFFLMNLGMQRTNKVICQTYEYFESCKFNYLTHKFVEVYAPVDYEYLDSVDEKIDIDYTKYNKTFKVGFLGRIVYEKGIGFLLDSLNFLETVEVHFFIAGDYKEIMGGSVMGEMKDTIEKYKDKITFLGKISDAQKSNFLKFIDVLVLPSIDPLEAFGIVQLEAMYFNTPLIASDLPGVKTIVEKTGYGYIVKRKNTKDIADRILDIIKNKEYFKKMNGRELVQKFYSKEGSIKIFIDTIENN